MEVCEVSEVGLGRAVDGEVSVEAVVGDERMGHPYSEGFHGMAGCIVVGANVGVVEVGYARHKGYEK